MRATVTSRRLQALLLAGSLLGLSLACVPHVRAQDAEPPKKEISEAVTAQLGKLRTLLDAKNYSEALGILNTLIAASPNPSFDRAILSQVKAQVLLFTNKYSEALAPLETTMELGERYGFFDQRSQSENFYTLGQLYYQLAATATKPDEQRAYFQKAYGAITRWIALSPKPTADGQLYVASILYGEAMVDPEKPDTAKLNEAFRAAESSLYLDLLPKPQAYVMMLAAYQQRGEFAPMAELLELLVSRQPDSAGTWQQLAGAYYALASQAKDEGEIQRYNLRALLTLERAQARGLLKSPKENYAVVALYFSLQQFDRAIALLETGLQSGSIENTRRNWEVLASAYQQIHKEDAAIATLTKAIARFPREAGLEFSLGQLYYNLNRPADAYDHIAAAVTKDHLERPGQTYLFLAYVAFELQRYEDAAKWVETAAKFPDAKADDLGRLRRAVAEKARDRVPPAKSTL